MCWDDMICDSPSPAHPPIRWLEPLDLYLDKEMLLGELGANPKRSLP